MPSTTSSCVSRPLASSTVITPSFPTLLIASAMISPMVPNLSSSSTSFATVTPSLVTLGAPKDLSSTTFRPRGPSVTVTASAKMFTPRRIFSRASWPNFTSLAAMSSPPSAFDHAEDVLLAHDEVFLAVDLDLRAGVLAEQDLVADLDVEGRQLAVIVQLTFADRDHLAMLRLLLGGIRDDDAALRLLHRLFEAPHDDAILKWPDLHAHRSFPVALSPRNAGKLRRCRQWVFPGMCRLPGP